MSRSYKKVPYCGDRKKKKDKRFANKRVRKASFEEIPLNGSGYKKLFETYNICDYCFKFISFKCFIEDNEETKEDLNRYLKYYFRK